MINTSIGDRKSTRDTANSSVGLNLFRLLAVVLLSLSYIFLAYTQTSSLFPYVFKGIVAQLQLLISLILVLKLERVGRITAFFLNGLSIVSVSIGYYVIKIDAALTGVFVAAVSLFIVSLVTHLFNEKNHQYELLQQQQKTTDALYQEIKKSEARLQSVNQDLVQANQQLDESRQRLHQLAYYDNLTGLPNRAMLLERIRDEISRCHAGKSSGFSVIFLDLDDFKQINDTLGHLEGDEYLRIIASRLSTIASAEDLCGRLSGDEFCIISRLHVDTDKLYDYCEQFRNVVYRKAMLDGNMVMSGASIGVARYPQDGINVRELLTSADNSMYMAKKSGKNSVNLNK